MRWVALLPLVLACSHHATPAPAPVATPAPAPAPAPSPAPPPRMFSEAEIAVFKAELIARVDANSKRACPGPQLLAPQVAGPSGPDIIAVMEPSGDLAACMTRLAAAKDLKAAVDAKAPEVVALEKDCGARLAAALHQASGHEGGCSPYQLGLRAEPASLLPVIGIAHLLGFHARLVADKEPMKALGILLDALRFAQDLERGHVTLIAAMIATATSELLATRAGAILDTAKLSKAQLDALAPALDRLIAGVPSFHEILQGEREAMALYFGVGLLEGPDWVPPGGWPTDMKLRGNQGTASGKHFGDPRDEAAAELAGMMQAADERDRACPAQATLATCKAGLDALGNAPPPSQELDLAALYKQGLADPDAMRRSIRTQIVNILASIVQPNFGRYVDKVIGTVAHLAALRIHVESLRTHKCPPVYAVPPALGQPLDVTADKGVVTVATWSFRCR